MLRGAPGAATAGQVWRYAVATGRTVRDVSTDIKGALKSHQGKNFAAATDPLKLGELICSICDYQGRSTVRAALQLTLILFQRPGELRAAAWAEINLDAALGTISTACMKRSVEGKRNGDPHLVPLYGQAVDIPRKLHPLTGPDVQSVHGFPATLLSTFSR